MKAEHLRKTPGRFPLSAFFFDKKLPDSLTRQLEVQIRTAIFDERLMPGDKLPSTRQLARELGVARNTMKNAYSQLIAEGYLEAAAGAGTRVAANLPDQLHKGPKKKMAITPDCDAVTLSSAGTRIIGFGQWVEANTNRPTRPFLPHTPSSDAFPRELWTKLTTRRLRQMSDNLLDRGDPRGFGPLRAAIADYVSGARGISCEAGQVVVTAGTQQAIELLAKLLIDPGDIVCMEDPGYAPAKFLFELAGAAVKSIPVDEEGICVEELSKAAPKARLVYVTPSSQFPLMMTLSLPRRLALIEWAQRSGAVILEDDYNGEYRYSGRLLPALHGLVPEDQCTIYTGSFSKLLFPSLRIGYLIVPHSLVDHLATTRWLIDRHSPLLEQAVLADFISEGHFARHIRRMRTMYASRQQALVEAAAKHWKDILHVPASDAGLHLIGHLCEGVSPDTVILAAQQAGIEMTPTSFFYQDAVSSTSFILGYAPFTEREIWRAAEKFASEFRKSHI